MSYDLQDPILWEALREAEHAEKAGEAPKHLIGLGQTADRLAREHAHLIGLAEQKRATYEQVERDYVKAAMVWYAKERRLNHG